ncbi:Mitochondrial copper homeostasis protein [Ascosphaera acerosa]|nr:Mitochondrial copper homeostasis protein [Ascosphaera acerosa]
MSEKADSESGQQGGGAGQAAEQSAIPASAQRRFNNKNASQYYDPCQEFATKSIRCLNRNGGNRELCSDYFQAYRDCKKAWMNARKTGN